MRRFLLFLTYLVVAAAGIGVVIGQRDEGADEPLAKTADVPAPDTIPSSVSLPVVRELTNSQNGAPKKLTPVKMEPLTGAYAQEQDIVVRFSDGTVVPVRMRRPELIHPPYEPVGRLIDQYDDLVQAAEAGDAPAARMLYLDLLTCSLQKQAHGDQPSDGTEHTHGVEENPDRCKGLSEAHLQNIERWAQMAAEGGDYLGIQYWGGALGKTNEAFEVFSAFWRDGNASALQALSTLYAVGAPASSKGQPDWVSAYAYHFIYYKLDEAVRTSGASWRSASRHIDTYLALGDHLRYLGGMLSPNQQQAAEALAAELLAENARCCVGNF